MLKLAFELHEIGIGHYDLEPKNILRCDDGTFKIIDFTLSDFHKCKGKKDVSIRDSCGNPLRDLRWLHRYPGI